MLKTAKILRIKIEKKTSKRKIWKDSIHNNKYNISPKRLLQAFFLKCLLENSFIDNL